MILMTIFFFLITFMMQVDDDNKEDDADDDNLEYHNTIFLKFDFIEVSSFVGLKPPSQALDSFYLVKIISRKTAQKYISDIYRCSIEEGQPAIFCWCLL